MGLQILCALQDFNLENLMIYRNQSLPGIPRFRDDTEAHTLKPA
jgi:hypothetical protein